MAVATPDRNVTDRLRHWLLTGSALTVPLVITLVVLGFVLNFLSGLLDPLVALVRLTPGIAPVVQGVVIEAIGLTALLVVVVCVGAVADVTEENYARTFHETIEGLPAVGDMYRSFRRMTDVFVESDTESFRDVKLVEFPDEGAYSIAFVTADPPGVIQEATGELEMQTLFVPLAPNPVMGGFLVHLSAERIHDVDLTVEEAVQAIVTSGVSVEAAGRDLDRPLSMDDLGDLGTVDGGSDGAERDPNSGG